MAYAAEENPAAYVGFGRVVGRVHGRSDSFVLPRTATSAGPSGERSAAWSVAPDSATGELLGLRERPGSSTSRSADTPSRPTTTSDGSSLGRALSESSEELQRFLADPILGAACGEVPGLSVGSLHGRKTRLGAS